MIGYGFTLIVRPNGLRNVRSLTRAIFGALPLQGGFHLPGKNWKSGVFASPKAPRSVFEHSFRNLTIFEQFFEILGKFVNKNAIKSDFWGVVGRYISKISKKSLFLRKIHLPTSKNF